MVAPFPRKHLENTNESIVGNILVAFHESGGHHGDLRLEPLKKVRQRGIRGELGASPTERSHKSLGIASKLGQLLRNGILKSLQFHALSFLHFGLILHDSIMCTHILKVFFKTLVLGGQSLLMMLNHHQL
jgi:hypothetical protein